MLAGHNVVDVPHCTGDTWPWVQWDRHEGKEQAKPEEHKAGKWKEEEDNIA